MATVNIPIRPYGALSAFTFTSMTVDTSSGAVGSFSTSPSHRLPSEDMRSDLPTKRLRSCLSPSRNRSCDEPSSSSSAATDPTPSPMASRSTSFSSADSSFSSAWRRKQVRWLGDEAGCEVASYHATWSASEYNRTPLDPPSPGERACIMPERNSRCLSPLELFSDSGRGRSRTPSLVADAEEEEGNDAQDEEDDSPRSLESIILTTPPSEEDVDGSEPGACDAGAAGGGDDDDDEDREWEACMERRRMMFAQMATRLPCGLRDEDGNDGDGESPRGPGVGFLDGYTSLSATLAELLKSVGCQDGLGGGGGPASTPQTVDDDDNDDDADRASVGSERTPVMPKRPIGPIRPADRVPRRRLGFRPYTPDIG